MQNHKGLSPAPLPRIPCRQDQPGHAIPTVLGDVVLLQHPERLGRSVNAHDVGGVEDVAKLVAGQSIGAGLPSVEFGAQARVAEAADEGGAPTLAQMSGALTNLNDRVNRA